MDRFSSLTSSSALSPNIIYKAAYKMTEFKLRTSRVKRPTSARHFVFASYQFPNVRVHELHKRIVCEVVANIERKHV